MDTSLKDWSAPQLPPGQSPEPRKGGLLEDAGKTFQLRRLSFVAARKPDQATESKQKMETINAESQAENDTKEKDVDDSMKGGKKLQVLYPKEKVQLKWKKMRHACVGLDNPGTMCFMNASFQILFHLAPLVAWMEDMLAMGSMEKCFFTGRVLRLFRNMQTSRGWIRATEFSDKNVIKQICHEYQHGRMEDAQEWMMGILGKMHDEAVEIGTGVPTSQSSSLHKDTQYTSFMHRIFGGKLQTQIACQKENFSKAILEPFASLEIEIGRANSVEDSLASFTKGEKLAGENQYKLEYGPGAHEFKMVDAIKTTTIHETPNVLMILLKRFPIPGRKITKKIEFGATLDIQPFLSGDSEVANGSNVYNLSGVVIHAGVTPQSGHYYSYAKAANGIWHCFDDQKVTTVSEATVLNSEAYVIVYTRQTPMSSPAPEETEDKSPSSTERRKQQLQASESAPAKTFDRAADLLSREYPQKDRAFSRRLTADSASINGAISNVGTDGQGGAAKKPSTLEWAMIKCGMKRKNHPSATNHQQSGSNSNPEIDSLSSPKKSRIRKNDDTGQGSPARLRCGAEQFNNQTPAHRDNRAFVAPKSQPGSTMVDTGTNTEDGDDVYPWLKTRGLLQRESETGESPAARSCLESKRNFLKRKSNFDDDYDEEYDRGKCKSVKKKKSYTLKGENPFRVHESSR